MVSSSQSYVAWIVLAILTLRAIFLTGSIITQELMELQMYPKQYLGVLFGMSQSAFFVGDALGGTLGGYVYSLNMNYALMICASFFLFNALTFPLFFKHILKKGIIA
ncbi:hypothetical protein [Staphylococcus microti]|nr:hypothetical protein [Staphylococcus microti]